MLYRKVTRPDQKLENFIAAAPQPKYVPQSTILVAVERTVRLSHWFVQHTAIQMPRGTGISRAMLEVKPGGTISAAHCSSVKPDT